MSKENIPHNFNEKEGKKIEKVVSFFNVNTISSKANLDKSLDLVNKGSVPIIVANHQSHADGIPVSLLAESVLRQTKQINGFYLVVALSAITGHQSPVVEKYMKAFEPILHKKHIEYLPVVRAKDTVEYGMSQLSNRESLRKIMRAESDRKGIIIFPEGTISGGRINPDTGKINGIVDCSSNIILDWSIESFRKGNCFVMPVAIDGSYLVSDYLEGKISEDDLLKSKVDAVLGSPIDFCTLSKNQEINKTDYVMRRISHMLPEEARGVYPIKTTGRFSLDQYLR